MKTFITSDIHFSHTNIMSFCPDSRKFNNIDEMDEAIIHMWNSIIGIDDLIYILGDIVFCPAPKATSLVSRLNGRKILIKGNHDSKLVKDAQFCRQFEEIVDYKKISFEGHSVVLFHYPIASEWDQSHRGSFHFHGHCHGKATGVPGRTMDVGMDTNNCVPYNLSEIIKKLESRLPNQHH